jgi:selenide,water dikinase
VMGALNKPGCDAALKVGVHACTDITGYGLVGHAFEMAEGSDVTIVLEASKVPLLPRTLEFARVGVLTRTHKTTRSFLGDKLQIDDAVEPALAAVLMDAQTSDGLLLSVAAKRAADLVKELAQAGAVCAAVVGKVDKPAGVRIRLAAER